MKTIIKWPGGKSREYKHIKRLIPEDTNTYIEPFFGGGGIYFKLEPKQTIINDINKNLMTFYQLLKRGDGNFKKTLTQIGKDWENLSVIADKVFISIKKYKNNINEEAIRDEVSKVSHNKKLPKLINGQEKYWNLLADGLIDKLQRIIGLEIKNGEFNESDFYSQIVAVTKGAYYYYLRDRFEPKTKAEEISRFFFLREYCFGSMFRFNSEGKFNIPYGGASYNQKSFHSKINLAFSEKVGSLLENTKIHCDDFRNFFNKVEDKISTKDFCFFDPPYDTEFSEYDQEPFGKKEQEKLAKLFGKLKCRALIIIKKTDFIDSIYKKEQDVNPNIRIKEYGKNYSYNVRGRNKRDVIHLLILNYNPQSIKRSGQLSFEEHPSSSGHVLSKTS